MATTSSSSISNGTATSSSSSSSTVSSSLNYMSGMDNEHSTEALPGALPIGQNSPQKVCIIILINFFIICPSYLYSFIILFYN